MSSTRHLRPLLLVLVALVAVTGVAVASAAGSKTASGTFTTTSATLESIQVDPNGDTVIHLSGTLAYTGTFSGTSTINGWLRFRPDGTSSFYDVEVFTGTVDGVPGTVTWNLRGGGSTSNGLILYHAVAQITGGSAGLAGSQGVLIQTGAVYDVAAGPEGTYSGHFRLPRVGRHR